MTTILVATYATLADALRTRHELQERQIPAENISVALRRDGSDARSGEVGELLTLGWLDSGSASTVHEHDIALALRDAGLHGLIASRLVADLDRGAVLIAARVGAASVEAAELVMSELARFPDLVGEVRESRMTAAEREASVSLRARDSAPQASAFV